MNEIFPLKKYWNNACFHSSFLWLKLSRKFIVQNVIQNSQKALILYFLMCKFKLFYWKVRDLASLQALFLKKKSSTQIWVFQFGFLLVCLKQHMAVDEGSVNPPKNLTIQTWSWPGHGIYVDFIDEILIFDDISNDGKKCDHSDLLVRGFLVRSSNFLPRLQLLK